MRSSAEHFLWKLDWFVWKRCNIGCQKYLIRCVKLESAHESTKTKCWQCDSNTARWRRLKRRSFIRNVPCHILTRSGPHLSKVLWAIAQVVCFVTKPWRTGKAWVDFDTNCVFNINRYNYSSKSTVTSPSYRGLITLHTTVYWPIFEYFLSR